MITGGDEVCILPPPTLSEKGVGIPTLSISLFYLGTCTFVYGSLLLYNMHIYMSNYSGMCV